MTNLQIVLVVFVPELAHIHLPVSYHGGSVPMSDCMASHEEIESLPQYLPAVGENSVLFIVSMGTLLRTEPGFFAFWNNPISHFVKKRVHERETLITE